MERLAGRTAATRSTDGFKIPLKAPALSGAVTGTPRGVKNWAASPALGRAAAVTSSLGDKKLMSDSVFGVSPVTLMTWTAGGAPGPEPTMMFSPPPLVSPTATLAPLKNVGSPTMVFTSMFILVMSGALPGPVIVEDASVD